MKPFRLDVEQFSGMARNAHPSKLPEGKVPLAVNCSHFRRGSWKVRKGLVHSDVDRQATSIDLLVGFVLRSGSYALLLGRNDALVGKNDVDEHTAATPASTALTAPATRSSSYRAYATVFGHRAYVTDGNLQPVYWDGLSSTLELAGITAPTQQDVGEWTPSPTQAAGNCSVGFHAVRFRYMDSRTGYVSDPSVEYVVEVTTGNGQLTFNVNTSGATNIIRSTESKVDTLVVEMTTVDGEEFFEAGRYDNSASTVVVSISDASLTGAPLAYPEDGHGIPPTRRYCLAHAGRLWIFGSLGSTLGDNTVTVTNGDATVTGSSLFTAGVAAGQLIRFFGDDSTEYTVDSVDIGQQSIELTEVYAGTTDNVLFELYDSNDGTLVYVSRAGYPESFDPDDGYVEPPTDASAAPLVAAAGFGNAMVFFSANSMWRLDWRLEPGVDGVRRTIGNRGAVNHRCVQVVETPVGLRMFTMDSQGVHVFDGVSAVEVAHELRELFDGSASDYPFDWDQDTETWFSVHFPRERAIRWYVTYGGATKPNLYLQLEYDTMSWSLGVTDLNKTSGAAVLSAEGLRPMLGDYLGHVWLADKGTVEGGSTSAQALTVAAGSTTTVVNVDETLPTSGVGLSGAPVTWFKGDGTQETGIVKSNTASAITLHLSTDTPASGDTGFASAPQVGDRLEVGRIVARLKTREWVAPRVGKRERPDWRYLYIEFEPLSSDRVFGVAIYKDGTLVSDYSEHLRAGSEAGVERPGTNPDYASHLWLVHANHADGCVRIPLGMTTTARLQVEILAYEPDMALEIHRMQLTGRSGEPHE